MDHPPSPRPVLFCFDGSDDAAAAIRHTGELLSARTAVVLTVWEPVAVWEPYDPGAILSAGLATLGAESLGLDEIASRIAREKMERGVAVAQAAGFKARGRLERGKPWRAICDTAEELDAEPIVLGARGLSRVRSAFLGSVSSAVALHAKRPVLVVPRAKTPA